jgi:hypothetical protein
MRGARKLNQLSVAAPPEPIGPSGLSDAGSSRGEEGVIR